MTNTVSGLLRSPAFPFTRRQNTKKRDLGQNYGLLEIEK